MFKSILAVMIPVAVALAPNHADAQISVSVGIAPPSARA